MTAIKRLIFSCLCILFLTSCQQENDKTIDFVYVNWAEGIGMVNVAKVILEENGYTVNLKNTDVAPLYASLAKGRSDVFLEAWLPVQDKEYIKRYGASIDSLSLIYDNAKVGFVVPEYVTIDSIDELNEQKEKFDEKIIGIDAGAGTMQIAEEAVSEYDLELDLTSSSESGMTSTLKREIEKENWVVVTGWRPHWKFSRWDLKILEDPKKTFGEDEKIISFSRKGFKEDQPEVAAFIEKMYYEDDDINTLMEVFEEISDNEEAAKEWIKNHKDLVKGWLPDGMNIDL